ncbi:MAG: oligosaccharide flippase family protein [Bacteroidota bacterium]
MSSHWSERANVGREFMGNLVRKGFFHLLGANLFTHAAGFIAQFGVAWLLLPVDIGRLRILQTYGTLATIFSKFGFDSSVLKVCSEQRPAEEKRGLLRYGLQFVAVASVAVSIVLLVFNALGLLSADVELRRYFYYYIPILLALSLSDLQMYYLQALKMISVMSKVQIATRSIGIVFMLVLTYFYQAVGYVAGLVVAAYFSLYWLHTIVRKFHGSVPRVTVPDAFRSHWKYANYSFLANALGQLNNYADLYLLNYLVSDRVDVGYYGFALMLLIPYNTVTGSIQQITTPYFSEYSTAFTTWRMLYNKYQRMVVPGVLAITLVSLVAVPPLVSFLFSNKYDNSLDYFAVLLGGWFVRNLYSLKGVAMWGLGEIRLNFFASLIALPLTVVSGVFLITHFQTIGAAYANAVGQIILFVLVSVIFRTVVRRRMAANGSVKTP